MTVTIEVSPHQLHLLLEAGRELAADLAEVQVERTRDREALRAVMKLLRRAEQQVFSH